MAYLQILIGYEKSYLHHRYDSIKEGEIVV